jgi:hypothetical protein
MGARKLTGWLALALCAGTLVLAFAPAAEATTTLLRPSWTVSTSWDTSPDDRDAWELLDDVIEQPTPPSSSSYYVEAANRGAVVEIGHADVPVPTGEQVTRITGWVWIEPGDDDGDVRFDLLSGSTVKDTITVPGSGAPGWRRLDATGALTQTDVDRARLRATLLGDAYDRRPRWSVAYVAVESEVPPQPAAFGATPGAAGSDPTPTWTFTTDAGTSAECLLERDGVAEGPWATCFSAHTPDLTLRPDGQYALYVRSVSATGAYGPPVMSTYVLDRAAPAPPSIDAAPASPTSDATPTWSFSGEPDATFECQITRGEAAVVPWEPCTSAATFDLAGEVDGTYVLEVRAVDAALNRGSPAASTIVLDRATPGTPSLAVSPGTTGSTRNPTVTFSAAGASTYECRFVYGTSDVLAEWRPCSSPLAESIPAYYPDGDYTLSVRGTSASLVTGPEATGTYVLDTMAPAAPLIDSGPGAATASTSPAFTWTGEPGASFRCSVTEGARVVAAEAACSSPEAFTLGSQPDGTYTFSVHAVDEAGNAGAPDTYVFDIDQAEPSTPQIDSEPPAAGQDPAVAWAFSGSGADHFECALDGPEVVQAFATCEDAHAGDLTGRQEGEYTFRVRGVSRTGVLGPEQTDTYRYDRTAPGAPQLTAEPASPSADPSGARWSFTGEAGASFLCRLERAGAEISDWQACTSPASYDLELPGRGDGTYDFFVVATDEAANTGEAAHGRYVLDRALPPAPVIEAAPPAADDDRTPEITFSGASPGFECRVTDELGAEVVGWTTCSPGTWGPLMPLAADGTYELAVRGLSVTGVPGPADAATYRLDTTAPGAPVISSGPDTPTADATPALAFAGEPGAGFECQARSSSHISAWATCTSAHTFDLSARADGDWTLAVRAIDAAGNTGGEDTHVFTLDRARPASPVIDASPGAAGATRSPSWSFSGPGARLECRIDADAAYAPCTSPQSFDLTGRPDGTYTFQVRAVSVTGVEGDPAESAYVLDTSGPEAPSITARPGAVGRTVRPAWSFTTPEPGGATACRVERAATGAVLADWAPCTSPATAELDGQADGTFRFLVRGVDALGNPGAPATDAYRLDRVGPPAPVISAAPGPLGSGRGPAWSFTGEAEAAFECRLEGPAGVVADWGACASPRAWDLSGAGDGPYTFVVRALDAAGNRGPEARGAYTLDTTPGGVQITDAPAPLGRERAPAWSFGGGEGGATYHCRLDHAGVEIAPWAPCATPHRVDLAGRPDGPYRFAVRAIDPAGNAGGEAAAAYTLDTTPPGPPSIARSQAAGRDRSPTFRFTAEAGAALSCKVERGDRVVSDWEACTSPFTADLDRSTVGPHRLRVRATDPAGNTGASAARAYELRAEPATQRQSTSDGQDGTERPQPSPGETPARAPEPVPAPVATPASEPVATSSSSDDDGDETAAPIFRGSERRRPGRGADASPVAPPAAGAPAATAPAGPSQGGRSSGADRSPIDSMTEAVSAVARAVTTVVTEHPDKTVFPISLIFLVIGFLGVQNRIDRSDPKLALAPVLADPDMEFPQP